MKRFKFLSFLISVVSMLVLIACSSAEPEVVAPATQSAESNTAEVVEEATTETVSEPTEEPVIEEPLVEERTVETMMRDSGLMVTVQNLGDVTVHSLTAPEMLFANSTHIIETKNSLVLIDTQFLLPMALDYRAYADSLDKLIGRLIITHEHPDHFLGSEAFADIDIYALAETSELIAEVGQAEVDEKQADFGDAIASTFVVPTAIEPGTIEIDGVAFDLTLVENAEADFQLVVGLPDYDVFAVGDIVYSGVHLIMAGAPPTWIEALNALKADSTDQTIVLAGHGLPGSADLYDANIAWLAKASELLGTVNNGDEWKAGLIEAFPKLGMDAAIDFVAPFLFSSTEGGSTMGLIEVITVELAEGATAETFVPTDQIIKDEYASKQPGYLARETAVSDAGLVRLSVHWESKADSDASIAGFGEAPGLEAFMGNLNPETMVIKQYELRSSTSGQVTFPGAGATEVITVKLLDGSDADDFVAANQALEESYITKQPGFIAREVGVSEDGEWVIIVHWETAADSAASIAKFEEAPGVETFMSFLNFETMTNTVYNIQQ
ncbi:MAG: MBL fold metallo-hydrolase [Anaerolineae bacterium]